MSLTYQYRCRECNRVFQVNEGYYRSASIRQELRFGRGSSNTYMHCSYCNKMTKTYDERVLVPTAPKEGRQVQQQDLDTRLQIKTAAVIGNDDVRWGKENQVEFMDFLYKKAREKIRVYNDEIDTYRALEMIKHEMHSCPDDRFEQVITSKEWLGEHPYFTARIKGKGRSEIMDVIDQEIDRLLPSSI